MASAERFGYEWDKYAVMTPAYEAQFRNWINPLGPADFVGQRILDAGCGMGRNSYWPLKWGAASLTAFDLDPRSVNRTKATLIEFNQATVVQASIYDLPWHNEFDLAMSIGVVHHLADPKVALERLVRALKPRGTLLLWVYSYEGNEWIVKYVNPVRKNITSKLPLPMVHFLSYFCSVPLWLVVKAYQGSPGYLGQLASFKFWHLHSIVFDQLIPTVANYWSKTDLEKLLGSLDLTDLMIKRPPNDNGWTIVARKRQF
jgi:SAM-dependent methyltransferase